jgi:hypothetical protein
MLEHTKTPPTDLFRVICSMEKAQEIRNYLVQMGCMIVDETEDTSNVLPNLTPAVALSGARYRENLTQQQLSDLTGIPRRHLSEMEHGKRTIGKLNSRRLGKALNVDPKRFLSV